MSFKDTIFGKVPDDWTVKKVGDIFELRQGLQISKKKRVCTFQDGYIPLLKITDLPTKIFSEFVTDIKENYIANKEDIIYTRTGNVGLVYTDVKGCVHNNCFKILFDNNEFYKYYIYYYLKNERMNKLSNSIASGSVQKDLPHSTFNMVEIGYPKIAEQKAIANILSTLDEKIETNNQINKTLEEMAQAIFKQWFVDFEFPNENGQPYKSSGGEMIESELGMIPKGWEVGKLDDIAIITMGQSPKGSSYNEDGDGVVFYQGRTDFTNRFPVRRLYTTEPKRMAKSGDILMSVRAPVGDINIANEECCIGRGLCSLKSNVNMESYLLYMMLKLKEKFNVFNGEGTVFGSINQKDLKGIKVIKPKKSLIEDFNKTVRSLDKQYFCLDKESKILTKIRDTLLPKLMSGEIRVPLNN